MSGILGTAITGANAKFQQGQRILISGTEGVGKTSLTCGAPNSLLIQLETGLPAKLVNQRRIPLLDTYEKVQTLLNELRDGAMSGRIEPGSTIVWDSASALQRLIFDKTLRTDPAYSRGNGKALTMEAALGGYGKAYSYANELFAGFLRMVDELAIYGGINSILTVHTAAIRVIDPLAGEYDTWELQLYSPKKPDRIGLRELATQWADMIGFMHEPLSVMKQAEGENVRMGISQNQGRVLGVERMPGYVAKNRYGIGGVIKVPEQDGWNYVADAIYQGTHGHVDLYNRG